MLAVVIAIALVILSTYSFLIKYGRLSHIPGPIHLPIVGNSLQLGTKPHMKMHEMVKKYGPVYRLNFQGNPCVIVCDFDTIYEMLVTKSADFAGRPSSYLANVLTEGQSGIVRTDYGPEVQGRRKLVHMYLKQYGVGMKKLEEITMDATTDMLQCLAKLNGKPVNINETLFNCVSDITAIMLLGETFSSEVITEIKQVFQHAALALSKSLSSEIVHRIPIMRYFGNRAYKGVMINVEMKASLIDKWLLSKPANGLIHHMQELTEDDKHKFHIDELKHHRQIVFDFLVAGVLTTSITLTVLMNVLSQRNEIQEKLRQEINKTIGDSRPPCFSDRERMPYHMATLLEINRYASIAPLAAPHKTTCNTSLHTGGKSIQIPAGTEVIPHLWSMHHSEDLWQEPFHFDPSRFLDSSGKLVDPDHPNRKHVMAFGAGHRVCVGEVFAMSRMFLILSRLVQTFHVLPETTVDKQPSCDPREMKFGSVLFPNDFKVRLEMI